MHITGVVKFPEIEGGFYAIQGADGVYLRPDQPARGVPAGRTRGRGEGSKRADAMSIRQCGPSSTSNGSGSADAVAKARTLRASHGLFLACSPSSRPPEPPAGFVNRVWKVSESSAVAPGTLYAFLSEGTIVIASEHGTPSFGRSTGAGHAR